MSVHFVNLLEELQRRSLRMANAVANVISEACDAVMHADEKLARHIIERDNDIDQEEVVIESEALRLMTLFQPMGKDMRQLCTIIKVNTDLERIADCAVNIAERTYHLPPAVAEEAGRELKPVISRVQSMLANVVQAYALGDTDLAAQVRSEDDTVDALYGQYLRKMVAVGPATTESMAARLDILSIAKNLERIADHATNIAEDVIYLMTGKIIRHSKIEPTETESG